MIELEYPWLNLVGHGSLWLPLVDYGFPHLIMFGDGCEWLTLGYYDSLWLTIIRHG